MIAELAPYRQALIPGYVHYCQTVTPRHMAMSIESVTYLWWLCDRVKAGVVCDLGSGFTSYALRAYAALAEWPVSVTSVDDSPEWLERTRVFLDEAGLPADGLVDWESWRQDPGGPYDVIVHDLAKGELRNRSMVDATAALAPGGMILFDDAQNARHRSVMWHVAQLRKLQMCDTRRWTTDANGRWSLLMVPA